MTQGARHMEPIPSNANARMPVWYIPHGGGPCFFMYWNPPDTWNRMAEFLKGLSSSLPCPPRAIVMVSAHWLEPQLTVTSAARPELIYDYYGFPPHTYELTYPAAGAPGLAQEVVGTLAAAGVAN